MMKKLKIARECKMNNNTVLITFDQFFEAYKARLATPEFRTELIKYVRDVWPSAVLDKDSLRVADIYGREGGVKAKSRGGSLILNIDINSLKFFWLNDFDPTLKISSSSILETLLLIYLGTKNASLCVLQDKRSLKMQLAWCYAEFNAILQRCLNTQNPTDSVNIKNWFKHRNNKPVHKKRFIANYNYYGWEGKLYDSVKHYIIDGGKEYLGNGNHALWPLYNLMSLKLLNDRPNLKVILVEGERKVNLLHTIIGDDVFVTCLRGGSPAMLQSHQLEYLQGKHIFIMRDLDEVGQKFAIKNQEVLQKNNILCNIVTDKQLQKLFKLDNLSDHPKYDVADFILSHQDNENELREFTLKLGEILGVTLSQNQLTSFTTPKWADKIAGLIRTDTESALYTTACNEDDWHYCPDYSEEEDPDEERWWQEHEEGQPEIEPLKITECEEEIDLLEEKLSDGFSLSVANILEHPIIVRYCNSENTAIELLTILDTDDEVLGLDTETQPKKNPTYPLLASKIGLHPSASDLRLIQIYSKRNNTVLVFDCNNEGAKFKILEYISAQPANRFVAHNADFELLHCIANAIELGLPLPKSIHCTHKQHRLLYQGDEPLAKHMGSDSSLEAIVLREFGVRLDKQYQKASAWVGEITLGKLKYAALDSIYALLVFDIFSERLKQFRDTLSLPGQLNKDIDEYENNIECLPAVIQASVNGLNISPQYYVDAKQLQEEAVQARKVVLTNTNINDNVRADLPTKPITEYLEKNLPIEILNTCVRTATTNEISLKTTNLSFILEKLQTMGAHYQQAIETVENLLNYRKLKHEVATQGIKFLEKHVINGKIHPIFNILGAKTGRMSCVKPNLQNISVAKFSRNYRDYYIPTESYRFIEFDFSMIEVVFFAYLSNNQRMIQVLESGADIHEYTAAILTGVEVNPNTFTPLKPISKQDRKKAKCATFGLLYGAKVKGFMEFAKNSYQVIFTESEANKIIKMWKATFAGVEETHRNWRNFAYKTRMFETVSGLMKITPKNQLNINVNEFFNFGIQGSAATLIKMTIRLLLERLNNNLNSREVKFINFVHDSVLLEVRNDESLCEMVESIIMNSCADALRLVIPQVPISLAKRCAEISVGNSPDVPWGKLISKNDRLKKKLEMGELSVASYKMELEKLYAKEHLELPIRTPVALNFSENTHYPTAQKLSIEEQTPYTVTFNAAIVRYNRYNKPYLQLLFKLHDKNLMGACAIAVWHISDNNIINPCRSLIKAVGLSYDNVILDDKLSTNFDKWAKVLNDLKNKKLTAKVFLKYAEGFLNIDAFLEPTTHLPITEDIIIQLPDSSDNKKYQIDDGLLEDNIKPAIILDVKSERSVRLNAFWSLLCGIETTNNQMAVVKKYLSKPICEGGWTDNALEDFVVDGGLDYCSVEQLIGKRINADVRVSVNPDTGKLCNNIEEIYPFANELTIKQEVVC